MPENEFEKKVSSEMQDLKFKPSEKVWLRVEERIQKKKKRRVFIIIFLLAGLALLGYWQRNNLFGGKENEIAKTETQQQRENNTKSTEQTNTSSLVKENTETKKQEAEKITNDKVINDKPVIDKATDSKEDIVVAKRSNDAPTKKIKGEGKGKYSSKEIKVDDGSDVLIDVQSTDPKKKKVVAEEPLKTKEAVVDKTNKETIVKQEDIKTSEIKSPENKIDSAKKVVEKEKNTAEKKDTVLKAEPAKEPVIAISQKDSSEKKWKWGLQLTPGISSLNNNSITLFDGMKSADALNYQGPPQTGSGAGVPPTRSGPSEVKAGFSFQAGFFAQRQLAKRTSLSLGLQYGFYSQRLHIGNYRDSLIGNNQLSNMFDGSLEHIYNAAGDSIAYTNRYHFIELPLRFQWQLNKSKSNPFVWSSGITIGQLISSNAIMYDTSFYGIYYQNKKLLNKTQLSLSTGFSWTIANGKKAQWSVGPVANIHLNRLIESPFENKNYLFFAGIRAGILFDSKK